MLREWNLWKSDSLGDRRFFTRVIYEWGLSSLIFEGQDRLFANVIWHILGFPGGSVVKVSVFNAVDLGSVPGSGRSPGGGNGNPLQSSCLKNPMNGGAWWAIVCGIAKNQTWLSEFSQPASQGSHNPSGLFSLIFNNKQGSNYFSQDSLRYH